MNTTPRAHLAPPGADLADACARALVERHRAALPDLSGLVVLLPAAPAAAHLQRCLARHAGRGLLGPQVRTLAGFADARASGPPPLTPLECRLLLTEALSRYRNLFPGQDNGHVAAALFELFEELTAHDADPGDDEEAFAARLARAYVAPPLAWLSREAQIVHKLWRAFGQDTRGRSPAATYRARLRQAFAAIAPQAPVQLLGFDHFSASEAVLVAAALREGRAELWLQGRLEGHDGAATRALCQRLGVTPAPLADAPGPASALLDAAFGDDAPPRAAAGAGPDLKLVEASGPEHEARCADLAVRQALLEGARDVVVLAADRRLARRLRALLERANVPLQDAVGWALSTSRAAAALDTWLDCLGEDFQFRPMLDLLKSGFVPMDGFALGQLERDLVYRGGIEHGLARFLAAAAPGPLRLLLQRLEAAAFALPPPGTTWPARRWVERVTASLAALGMTERLQPDDAGAVLLRLLATLDAAFTRVPLSLRWDEFRELLDGALERETFVPAGGHGGVRLVTLEQSQNLRCDCLILAGATRDALPGAAAREPFFNAAVRAELGLPDEAQRRAVALARLRRALEAAPRVRVLYAGASDEEPAQPSPWLEAVQAQAAHWGWVLHDPAFARLAASAAVDVGLDGAPPAAPQPRPAPAASAELLPAELSATAHQALLDCPYQFFARSLLRLRPERAPDEDPDRRDYGERVHRILQAFTEPVDGLPPPFGEAVTAANRDRARARLEEITQAVLGPDLDRRALALTWRAEFRAAIPRLVDWLATRPPVAAVQAETELRQDLDGLPLIGRADRLETRRDGSCVVVDYKAGRTPDPADVERGEAVQLLHYALLDPRIAAVEYRPVREGARPLVLEDALPGPRDAARERLRRLLAALRAGAALPAHGDEETCGRCDYAGLCRRDDWPAAGGPGDLP